MKHKYLFTGLILLYSIFCVGQKTVWKPITDMPKPIRNSSAVVYDSCIFVFGGMGTPNMNSTYMYDIRNKRWEQKANIPQEQTNCATVIVNDKIYLIGGSRHDLGTGNLVYDPKADTWTELQPIPTGRHHLYGTVLDNKIHIIGGMKPEPVWDPNNLELLDHHEVYDPETDTWDTLAPLPLKSQNVNLSTINHLIYATGGQGDKESVWNGNPFVFVYDPLTNKWDPKPDLAKLPYADNSTIVNDNIFLITADFPDTKTTSFAHYNTSTGITTLSTPLDYVCIESSFVSIGKKLFVLGGAEHGYKIHSKVFEGTVVDSGNFIPELNILLKDDSCFTDNMFTYNLPEYSIIDDDVLTYQAVLANGDDLPNWLEFNSNSLSFTGKPQVAGILLIKVIATDSSGASVSDEFKLKINKNPTGLNNSGIRYEKIKIYPVPCKNEIFINTSQFVEENLMLKIISLSGRVLFKSQVKNKNVFDISNLANGLYLV